MLALPAGPFGVEGALGLVRAGSAHPTPRSFPPTMESSSLGRLRSSWCPAQTCPAQSRGYEAVILLTEPPLYGSPGLGTLSAVPMACSSLRDR